MAASDKKIDPVLLEQLDAGKGSVQAVFRLAVNEKTLASDKGAGVEETVSALLSRVADSTGQKPSRCTVFKRLGSFAVEAPPEFLRALLREGEIAGATANRRESP